MSATTTAPTASDTGAPVPAPRRFGILTLVLGVVAGLLLGFALGVLTLRPATPGDDSPEAGFARDMSTHHAQAVAMGMIAYQNATMLEVRTLGGDIATTQQGQIGVMQQWLRQWNLLPTGAEPPMSWMGGEDALENGLMPGMATPAQMEALRNAEGVEVDRLFLEMLTVHHLGGIHMIDGVLERTDNPDVRWLAQLQKDGQQKEIRVLQDLQAQLPTG